jgi:hypothetical protein
MISVCLLNTLQSYFEPCTFSFTFKFLPFFADHLSTYNTPLCNFLLDLTLHVLYFCSANTNSVSLAIPLSFTHCSANTNPESLAIQSSLVYRSANTNPVSLATLSLRLLFLLLLSFLSSLRLAFLFFLSLSLLVLFVFACFSLAAVHQSASSLNEVCFRFRSVRSLLSRSNCFVFSYVLASFPYDPVSDAFPMPPVAIGNTFRFLSSVPYTTSATKLDL